MKALAAAVLLAVSALCSAQQEDADTYLKVERARAEVAGCSKLLSNSKAAGSLPILLMTYTELDKRADELEHCAFVFRIVGDTRHSDEAGDEGDRYDAAIAQQMEKYLKMKNLWEDFLKQDCRMRSSGCGKK